MSNASFEDTDLNYFGLLLHYLLFPKGSAQLDMCQSLWFMVMDFVLSDKQIRFFNCEVETISLFCSTKIIKLQTSRIVKATPMLERFKKQQQQIAGSCCPHSHLSRVMHDDSLMLLTKQRLWKPMKMMTGTFLLPLFMSSSLLLLAQWHAEKQHTTIDEVEYEHMVFSC